jgi:hypothetical protein
MQKIQDARCKMQDAEDVRCRKCTMQDAEDIGDTGDARSKQY